MGTGEVLIEGSLDIVSMLIRSQPARAGFRDPPGVEGRSSTFRISLAASLSNASEHDVASGRIGSDSSSPLAPRARGPQGGIEEGSIITEPPRGLVVRIACDGPDCLAA